MIYTLRFPYVFTLYFHIELKALVDLHQRADTLEDEEPLTIDEALIIQVQSHCLMSTHKHS